MENQNKEISTDIIVIGAGVIGLAIAHELLKLFPRLNIKVLEKEPDVAMHASGRNSGVLHAGFYYTKDSLKARFTVEGNQALKDFCRHNSLRVNECGKVVVAKNKSEVDGIKELHRRGMNNGVKTEIIDEKRLFEIEPAAKTCEIALWSPDTASVSPKQVCHTLKNKLELSGVEFVWNEKVLNLGRGWVQGVKSLHRCKYIINTAGLYADHIAQKCGLGRDYTIIPFKGVYLKYNGDKELKTHVYPVPNLLNPFLGVHYTKTVDGEIKIGPTSIPCLWREQYNFTEHFKFKEMLQIMGWEALLFGLNSFHFRTLAFQEIKKYNQNYLFSQGNELLREPMKSLFSSKPPGIRAQLLNKKSKELVMDFVVEHNQWSTHVLNAVSPAFTCSFPFASYVIEGIIRKKPNLFAE